MTADEMSACKMVQEKLELALQPKWSHAEREYHITMAMTYLKAAMLDKGEVKWPKHYTLSVQNKFKL